MDKQIYTLFNKVRQNWCDSCDGNCQECVVSEVLDDIKNLDFESTVENSSGCAFCWDDKRKRSKEIFFFDAANNMRISEYCPNCGRKY
jgi:hypothetical protein